MKFGKVSVRKQVAEQKYKRAYGHIAKANTHIGRTMTQSFAKIRM